MPHIEPVNDAIRGLTPAEKVLVANVFGSALNAESVMVRRQKWWMFQPWWITMAPDGHIWCHPNGQSWSPCYASDRPGMQAHFVHEMTHVWQHQQGVNLLLRRLPWAPYGYVLKPGKRFADYGIEQQACIVADAYLINKGHTSNGKPTMSAYADLIPFGRWG